MLSNVKAKLIDDWHRAWKLWSVQINAIGLVLMGVVELLKYASDNVPPSLVNKLPHGETIATVCFVLSMGARLLKQEPKKPC